MFLRAFWLVLLWQVGLQAWNTAVFLEYPFILRISSTSPMFCALFFFQACFSLDWNTFSSSFLRKSPFFKITALLLDLSLFCHIWEFGNNCPSGFDSVVWLILFSVLLVKDLKPFECFTFLHWSHFTPFWSKGSWNCSDSLVWVPFHHLYWALSSLWSVNACPSLLGSFLEYYLRFSLFSSEVLLIL